MDPITLALITSAIGAATKTGLAAAQNAKSKKLANQKRPEQQVPEAVQLATQSAQQAYNNPNMVGYDMAKTQLRSNAADANYALQQQGGNNNAVTAAIAGNTNNSLNDLYQQYVNRKDNLRGQMIGQLNSQGQYEQSNFEVNKLQPYLDAMKAAAAQKGAATQNLGGAITDVTSGLTATGGMMNANAQNADLLKALGGGAGGTSVLPSEGIANVLNGVKPPVGTNSVLAPMTQQEAISAALPSIIRAQGIGESTPKQNPQGLNDPLNPQRNVLIEQGIGGNMKQPINNRELLGAEPINRVGGKVSKLDFNQPITPNLPIYDTPNTPAPKTEAQLLSGVPNIQNALKPLSITQPPEGEPMVNVEAQIQNFAKSPKKGFADVANMGANIQKEISQLPISTITAILNSTQKFKGANTSTNLPIDNSQELLQQIAKDTRRSNISPELSRKTTRDYDLLGNGLPTTAMAYSKADMLDDTYPKGGEWHRGKSIHAFTPSAFNLSQFTADEMSKHFKEEGFGLNLPESKLKEITNIKYLSNYQISELEKTKEGRKILKEIKNKNAR